MWSRCAVADPAQAGQPDKDGPADAINLARLHRAGELTPVWVPDQTHEAICDLVRARLVAVRRLRQARQQLSGFLLRHGHHYHRPTWTLKHRRGSDGTARSPAGAIACRRASKQHCRTGRWQR